MTRATFDADHTVGRRWNVKAREHGAVVMVAGGHGGGGGGDGVCRNGVAVHESDAN